jgi:hypothetical protein
MKSWKRLCSEDFFLVVDEFVGVEFGRFFVDEFVGFEFGCLEWTCVQGSDPTVVSYNAGAVPKITYIQHYK